MNRHLVVKVLGIVLLLEAALMLPSVLVSLIYGGGDAPAFVYSILILLAVGIPFACVKAKKNKRMYIRDGFAIVGLSWVFMSAFGALPYFFSGAVPDVFSAFFESVSGFTTTSASVLKDVESVSKGILFWRSFTNWIGGMGVLMFTLAIIPAISGNTSIMKAESTGYSHHKIVPKMGSTAKIFYFIYTGMTLLQIIVLKIAGLSLYDSFLTSFATAGTGGFSNLSLSVGGLISPAAEWIIGIFMLVYGVNFALYFFLLTRNFRAVLKSTELKLYLAIVVISVIMVSVDISKIYSLGDGLIRHSFFQVSSLVTTTGFTTQNFDAWPNLSKSIILVLMMTGAMTGSTAGGIKLGRILILVKSINQKITKLIHPNVAKPIKVDNKIVPDETVSGITIFFFVYMFMMFSSLVLISFNELSVVTNLSAVIACIGNVGIGLDAIGPLGSYSVYNPFAKMVLSFCMLAGRLEILPMVLIIMPSFWKRKV